MSYQSEYAVLYSTLKFNSILWLSIATDHVTVSCVGSSERNHKIATYNSSRIVHNSENNLQGRVFKELYS